MGQTKSIANAKTHVGSKNINSSSYGQINVFLADSNPLYTAEKILDFTSILEYNNIILILQKEMLIGEPHILKFLYFSVFEEKKFCSILFSIKLYMPYYMNLDIYLKNGGILLLRETDYYSIICSVIYALAAFQKNKIDFQNVCLENILLTQKNFCEILNLSFLHNNPNLYEKFRITKSESEKSKLYISPILLSSAKEGNNQPVHIIEKSNVFSLAMLMINIFINSKKNTNSLQIYDYIENKIIWKNLSEIIDQIENTFSSSLAQLLEDMLQENERERIGYEEVKNFFRLKKFIPIPLPNPRENFYQEFYETDFVEKKKGFLNAEVADVLKSDD